MTIEPASKNRIKTWRKLQQSKYRKKNGQFIAEGLRCVNQIIENRIIDIDCVLVDKGTVNLNDLSVGSEKVYSVSSEDFISIADTDNPQGVVAICNMPSDADIKAILSTNGFLVAFDAIQDPGNMGTMIRTASWFGVSGLIFGDGCVDQFHPKVVRSTAGATGTLPFISSNLDGTFSALENNGYQILLLDGSTNSVSLKSKTPQKKTVLVVGNEGNGIDESYFKPNRTAVRIDGANDYVESLNAAVALSIGLFQLATTK